MRHPTSPEASSATDKSQWFASEIQRHEAQLKSYLRGSFPSIRDVDDVVQESYARVWRRQLSSPLKCVRSFLYSVARNLAIDSLRRKSISPIRRLDEAADQTVPDNQPDPAAASCINDEVSIFVEILNTLPPRPREILILRKFHGLSHKEIAARLGISEGTAQVHAIQGMRRCEQMLKKRGVV